MEEAKLIRIKNYLKNENLTKAEVAELQEYLITISPEKQSLLESLQLSSKSCPVCGKS